MNLMKEQAKLFGIPNETAINIELRYLTKIIIESNKEGVIYWAIERIFELLAEKDRLKPKPTVLNNMYLDTVTPEMIEQAHNYPLNQLLNFNSRNQTLAFCHDDKRPSLHWNPAKKKCFCNVCNKAFSPIDIVMHQQGLSFYDSVRFICNI